ncbi:hypothetical protein [Streptomyces sp. NPDC048639]|uniref:hypothetical protein n=1 Tax=Streptomyces sp. NPDC048639 TaxID=3365581 RepID=UPI00371BF444
MSRARHSVTTQAARGAAPESLGIYLNDHLAGSTAGVELSRRIAQRHHGGFGSGELERLAQEIARDRASLLGIMEALGVPVRRYKIAGGWIGEKFARLKPNGRVVRSSGLGVVIELETLRLGVEGKYLLWRALEVVADPDSPLDPDELYELKDRARDQIEILESLRIRAASAAFAPGVPAPQ